MHPTQSFYCQNTWIATYSTATEHGAHRTLLVQWRFLPAENVYVIVSLYKACEPKRGLHGGGPRDVWGCGAPWPNHTGVCFATGVLKLLLRDNPAPGFTVGTPPEGAVAPRLQLQGLGSACSPCPFSFGAPLRSPAWNAASPVFVSRARGTELVT